MRKLSLDQAVQATAILFELNTEPRALSALYQNSALAGEAEEGVFISEWLAYVHACLVHGLMENAPAVVVVEYLRQTRAMLESRGYALDLADDFIDRSFSRYLAALAEQRAKDCPSLLFQALLGKEIAQVPAAAAGSVSAAMGLVLAAILDKLEEYEYSCG